MFLVSEAWKTAYSGASVGVLTMTGVANPKKHATLEGRKGELEAQLRARFGGYGRADLKALPTLQAYSAYHKLFVEANARLVAPDTRTELLEVYNAEEAQT